MKPQEIRRMANQILSDKPSTIQGPPADDIETGVDHMTVDCLKNGYMCTTHHRATADTHPEPEKHFFPDHEKVAAHVRATLGAHIHGKEDTVSPNMKELKT